MSAFSGLRRIPFPVFLALAFAGGVTWLVLSDPPEPETDPSPVLAKTADVPALPAAPTPAPEAPTKLADNSAVPLPRQLRNVSPDGMRTPVVTAPIKRIEPSEIYLERVNPPVDPLPEGPLELHRPEVVDAGTLKTKAFTVRLAWIKPLGLKETCVSRVGGQWPCGVRARTALRGLIRMNKIACEKVAEEGPNALSANCSRGPINLAAWMVENGWAVPDEGAPEDFAALMNKAREQKAGQWQSEWLTELPQTAEAPEALDETLLPSVQEGASLRTSLDDSLSAPEGMQQETGPDLLNPLGLPQDQGTASFTGQEP
ncbi:thermonuclease family protein [Roseibium suaedae]|uniref:Thermonuclease family protein n=1 Tax=Roseibium suaedae TaxID=735517 RepID=A0A1M7BDK4_9HYPH|nr:thermonuclease family protein [Roseibium suaedae]SHL53108.1 hypothetical protein SAMN05444272_0801 [Roseibium suaedae]